MTMTCAQLMKVNPKAVHEDAWLEDVDWEMLTEQIRHVPVVDRDDKLVGILSDRDVILAARSFTSRVRVGRVMQREVVTVGPDTPAVDAVERLIIDKIGALPVVEKGRLIGILTSTDFLAVAYRALAGVDVTTIGRA